MKKKYAFGLIGAAVLSVLAVGCNKKKDGGESTIRFRERRGRIGRI